MQWVLYLPIVGTTSAKAGCTQSFCSLWIEWQVNFCQREGRDRQRVLTVVFSTNCKCTDSRTYQYTRVSCQCCRPHSQSSIAWWTEYVHFIVWKIHNYRRHQSSHNWVAFSMHLTVKATQEGVAARICVSEASAFKATTLGANTVPKFLLPIALSSSYCATSCKNKKSCRKTTRCDVGSLAIRSLVAAIHSSRSSSV